MTVERYAPGFVSCGFLFFVCLGLVELVVNGSGYVIPLVPGIYFAYWFSLVILGTLGFLFVQLMGLRGFVWWFLVQNFFDCFQFRFDGVSLMYPTFEPFHWFAVGVIGVWWRRGLRLLLLPSVIYATFLGFWSQAFFEWQLELWFFAVSLVVIRDVGSSIGMELDSWR